MDINFDTILSLFGLLGLGGGSGAFFTWKWMNRKAKAEAVTAEIDAAKDVQELYKKMIDHSNEYLEESDRKLDAMRAERDQYMTENGELRTNIEQLTKEVFSMKTEGQKERAQLRSDIDALKEQMAAIKPKTCIVEDCPRRQIMETSRMSGAKTKTRKIC